MTGALGKCALVAIVDRAGAFVGGRTSADSGGAGPSFHSPV
jgi:hypothetical protein